MVLAHSYLFLLDRTNYSDSHYLMLLCNFLFFLVDAHRTHSVDNFFFFKNAKSAVPYWQIFAFQMQVIASFLPNDYCNIDNIYTYNNMSYKLFEPSLFVQLIPFQRDFQINSCAVLDSVVLYGSR